MRRVHMFVHGRGQGHGTRCLAIGRGLQGAGFEVEASAGAGAIAVLRDAMPTHPVRSLPMGPFRAAGALPLRVASAIATLRRRRPDAVVSDGDLPGALAARALGIRVIAVGHGLTFLACRRPALVDPGAWRREAAKAWVAARPGHALVAVNFVPLRVDRDDTVLARPSVELPSRGDAVPGKVVCYFRDGVSPAARRALRALVDAGKAPVTFGAQDPGVPGVAVRPRDRAAFVAELAIAEAVVASAGSQLISEALWLGLPFFGLFDPADDEQALNVAMLRDAGGGDGCATEALVPTQMLAALARPPRAELDAVGPCVVEAVVAAIARC